MAKTVKLIDLKVADLKRELEERDLDTSGNKSVLQQRLRQALASEGEDPEAVLFESSDVSKMLNALETRVGNLVTESTSALKAEFVERNKTLKAEVGNLVLESNKNLKDDVLEVLENKFEEFSGNLENKISKVESNISDLESKINVIENEFKGNVNEMKNDFDEKINVMKNELYEKVKAIESKVDYKLEGKLRLSDMDRQRTSASGCGSPVHLSACIDSGVEEEPKLPPARLAVPGSSAANTAVPVFDGKMSWEDYMTLFETAAMVHGWSTEAKASVLCLSLRGDALGVLQTMPMSERQNYPELVRRLEMRFGHRHMDQLYRSQLRNRVQKANESLQEFEADIARLVRNAYPSVTDDVYESLAVDKFLDGLREPETQQAVKLARPKTLSDALTQALEFEAVKQSVRGQARVRAAEAEPVTSPSLEEIVKRVLEALKTRKKEVRCWGCGQLGHPRSKCKNKTPEKQQEN